MKLIEHIQKERDKMQAGWKKSQQLRDNRPELYSEFLHGKYIGYVKAYNNVLQWLKDNDVEK